MSMDPSLLRIVLLSGLTLITPLCEAAQTIKPDRLQTPAQLTCVNLTEPLSFSQKVGLLKILWTLRLERGPYLSEKTDGQGTFYRTPPGGLRLAGGEPATEGHGRTYDGGFYLPDDPNQVVRIYFYGSNSPAPVEVPASNTDCSTAGYVKDPATQKVSAFAMNTAGTAIIGAAVDSSVPNSLSHGQRLAGGAVGGGVAFVIISVIANADVGKIYFPEPPRPDPEFIARLKAIGAQKVPLKEVSPADVARGSSVSK